MFKSTALIALSSLLFTSVSSAPLEERQIGPKIDVLFYKNGNCSNSVEGPLAVRIGKYEPCYNYPNDLYSSLQILDVDDALIGTNTNLEVGLSRGDSCEWQDWNQTTEKYYVGNRHTVWQCQRIAVNLAPGFEGPFSPGNEFRLSTF